MLPLVLTLWQSCLLAPSYEACVHLSGCGSRRRCLQALVASGRDLLHEEVPLVGPEGNVWASLTISVVAAAALGSIA